VIRAGWRARAISRPRQVRKFSSHELQTSRSALRNTSYGQIVAQLRVDAEGLPQVGSGLAGIAVLEVGPAESFQGSCLLEGHADVPRDGERLGVALAGLGAGLGAG
jgi:hypothetical protein